MKANRPLFLVGILTLSCGGDTTTGVRVVLHTEVTSDLGSDPSFTTGLGWTITLSEAAIATGPLYYFDGEPAFTDARPLMRRLLDVLTLTSPAYAHPGHYVAGQARGEVIQSFSVDLRSAAPTSLPDGDGVSGRYRSGTFSFSAPTAGPALQLLDGHAVKLSGRATKDQAAVYFTATIDLADLEATAADAAVTGCVFKETEVSGDGTVTITVRPRVWFSLVDFSELDEGTAAAPTPMTPESTAHIALALGLTQLSAYQMAFTPNEGS